MFRPFLGHLQALWEEPEDNPKKGRNMSPLQYTILLYINKTVGLLIDNACIYVL